MKNCGIKLTEEHVSSNGREFVFDTEGKLSLIFLYSDLCGHCHTMAPNISALIQKYGKYVNVFCMEGTQKTQTIMRKMVEPNSFVGYPTILRVSRDGRIDSREFANKRKDLEVCQALLIWVSEIAKPSSK